MRELLRFTSMAGVRHVIEGDDQGNFFDRATQNVAPILDINKAMANHNDGYTPSRDLRRVATIPAGVRLKWMIEEGWDCLNPDHADKLTAKLNDPDYSFLRTAPGRIGYKNGTMR
jgi:hypothetical protein